MRREPVLQGLLIAGAALAIVALYAFRLESPPVPYYDEVYHVAAARAMLDHNRDMIDTAHPPLGKALMALSISMAGDHGWGWRLAALASGLGCILLVYRIARTLTANVSLAGLAALLFALDGISLTQARIGMLNAPMLFFMLAAADALIAPRHEGISYRRVFLGGAFAGLALATRWAAAGILPLLATVLAFDRAGAREKWRKAALLFTALIAAYFSAHLIYVFRHGLTWPEILRHQLFMARYHLGLRESHGYGSAWWSWPMMLRPIWYTFATKGGRVQGILCLGNPAVVWLLPAGVLYALVNAFRKKEFPAAWMAAGFFAQWLPWALSPRVAFFHYYATVMPFGCMALALLGRDLAERGKAGRILVAVYVLAAAAMFLYWYPLLTGWPVSEAFYLQHMWLRSWV